MRALCCWLHPLARCICCVLHASLCKQCCLRSEKELPLPELVTCSNASSTSMSYLSFAVDTSKSAQVLSNCIYCQCILITSMSTWIYWYVAGCLPGCYHPCVSGSSPFLPARNSICLSINMGWDYYCAARNEVWQFDSRLCMMKALGIKLEADPCSKSIREQRNVV